MYCSNCGNNMNDGDAFCAKCGATRSIDHKTCPKCGTPIARNERFCSNCGCAVEPPVSSYSTHVQKSRLVAGLLGILIGGIGIHNFYLGNNTRGVLQIIVTLVTCGVGAVWGFIEGILILCRHINYDAFGIPLKEDC